MLLKKKKILVTGGAGYLGSVLTNRLLEKECEVTVLDIGMFGSEGLISHFGKRNFAFVKGDVRDEKLLKSIFKKEFNCVIHLAALVGEPACEVDPNLAREINYKASVMLGKIAKENGVDRFIFMSSSSNYGVSKPNEFADENSVLNPLTLYAKTKVDAEKDLLLLNDTRFSVCIIRLAALFGLSPKMRFNLLINEFVRNAYFGKDLILYKKNAWRPYTHTEDAVDALIAILNAKKRFISGQIFNVGTENCQKKDLVKLVKRNIESIKIVEVGGEADNRDYKVSFEKIKQTLGFCPKKHIKDGIEEIFWAMKNNIFSNPYDEKYSAWINTTILNKKIC